MSTLRSDEPEGEEPTVDEIAAWLAASLQEEIDRALLTLRARSRAEHDTLRRSIEEQTGRLASERRRRAASLAAAGQRVDELEVLMRAQSETIAEMGKAIGSLQREIAEERALRRLFESRRMRSHSERVVAEVARRKLEREHSARREAS